MTGYRTATDRGRLSWRPLRPFTVYKLKYEVSRGCHEITSVRGGYVDAPGRLTGRRHHDRKEEQGERSPSRLSLAPGQYRPSRRRGRINSIRRYKPVTPVAAICTPEHVFSPRPPRLRGPDRSDCRVPGSHKSCSEWQSSWRRHGSHEQRNVQGPLAHARPRPYRDTCRRRASALRRLRARIASATRSSRAIPNGSIRLKCLQRNVSPWVASARCLGNRARFRWQPLV